MGESLITRKGGGGGGIPTNENKIVTLNWKNVNNIPIKKGDLIDFALGGSYNNGSVLVQNKVDNAFSSDLNFASNAAVANMFRLNNTKLIAMYSSNNTLFYSLCDINATTRVIANNWTSFQTIPISNLKTSFRPNAIFIEDNKLILQYDKNDNKAYIAVLTYNGSSFTVSNETLASTITNITFSVWHRNIYKLSKNKFRFIFFSSSFWRVQDFTLNSDNTFTLTPQIVFDNLSSTFSTINDVVSYKEDRIMILGRASDSSLTFANYNGKTLISTYKPGFGVSNLNGFLTPHNSGAYYLGYLTGPNFNRIINVFETAGGTLTGSWSGVSPTIFNGENLYTFSDQYYIYGNTYGINNLFTLIGFRTGSIKNIHSISHQTLNNTGGLTRTEQLNFATSNVTGYNSSWYEADVIKQLTDFPGFRIIHYRFSVYTGSTYIYNYGYFVLKELVDVVTTYNPYFAKGVALEDATNNNTLIKVQLY